MKVRASVIRGAGAALAAVLVILALDLPLWTMTLRAPQYPKGLQIRAFGDRLEGDLREINGVNHYIGMAEIKPQAAAEMALFPWSIAALVTLLIAAAVWRRLVPFVVTALIVVPAGILADLQWWLYRFGHDLHPDAPLRIGSFTPRVLGTTTVLNFETRTAMASGLMVLFAAAIVLLAADWIGRRGKRAVMIAFAIVAGMALLYVAAPAGAGVPSTLQRQIDTAAAGTTLVVRPGTYRGSVTIAKPLILVGKGVTLDGEGRGSVVVIDSDDVAFVSFTIRNSGNAVTEEAAAIKARGNRLRIESNTIAAVQFGIHVTEAVSLVIRNNTVAPGRGRGYRGGDGISLWNVRGAIVEANRVRDARDGIYLSFTEEVRVLRNEVSGSRYGVHSMFSQRAVISGNYLHENLLGAALMNSDRLVLDGNRIERHRVGATAYGVLLKDIGELLMRDNDIRHNRVGLYADSAPDRYDREARVTGNRFAGNDTAFALQSNVRLVVTGNAVIDNLMDVQSRGNGISRENRWSDGRRGNFWSLYQGFDRDGDDVGDLPYRVEGALDHLFQRHASMRAFLFTPAHTALETAARLFPLFRAEPLLTDPYPLMNPPRSHP